MADNNKIKTTIKCQNIAPLENLNKEIQSSSLKIAVFANNGCGKTFISRLFRILENQKEMVLKEDGTSPTDKLLSFGKTAGNFSFKITNKNGVVQEDVTISFTEKKIPTIPTTNYLYHTFNQDYVEENIRALDYEKESDIEGFILGKANIDLTDDEHKLTQLETDGKNLRSQIESEINKYLEENINNIRDIKRLTEYKLLDANDIFESVNKEKQSVSKTFSLLLDDYNKIKSVPENLFDIQLIKKLTIDINFLNEIKENAAKEYSLSSLAEDFKQKIKDKQAFVEIGIELLKSNNKKCPFCEQELKSDALSLIDHYTEYLNNTEAQTIKLFQNYSKSLFDIINSLKGLENEIIKTINTFNDYKTKYIPSCENVELTKIEKEQLISAIYCIIDNINEKLKNINVQVVFDDNVISEVEKYYTLINKNIDDNNKEINNINAKKNKIGEEDKSIRKEICKCAYNYLVDTHLTNIKNIIKLRDDYKKLKEGINKKKEAEKISKKSIVATTIKTVLNCFFSDKYTLNEESFRLIFNKTTLEKGQVKNVLSEGEKNIIAFAYYIGDTHLKVEKEDDYEKLFFVIDDPISSMDFTHVYTLCGVIRDIKQIINKLNRERFIILTHNNDFMRIISANNIVEKKLILKNGEITEFNNNLTVPYISHLLDIHKIARRKEKANHTTANSIRHIIETLTKFQNIETSSDSIAEYIKENIPNDTKSYTLIQDLSHGGWRSEQQPITDDDYKDVCETIIAHIEKKFTKQIEYCEKVTS
ncbi:MAG: AAA family ATPase [Prevotellaceae bacterium]|nr:AAA family ATPase [Prevotellaceae bacterium]